MIDTIQCKICGKEYKRLGPHIPFHSMTVAQYLVDYGGPLSPKPHAQELRLAKIPEITDPELLDCDTTIQCKICRETFQSLTNHIKTHDITREEYLEKYGGPLVSELISKRQSKLAKVQIGAKARFRKRKTMDLGNKVEEKLPRKLDFTDLPEDFYTYVTQEDITDFFNHAEKGLSGFTVDRFHTLISAAYRIRKHLEIDPNVSSALGRKTSYHKEKEAS